MLIAVSGWMNHRQQLVIDYLREENRVLREQLGGRRARLDDNQRRRLAVKAKALGRKALDATAHDDQIVVTRELAGRIREAGLSGAAFLDVSPRLGRPTSDRAYERTVELRHGTTPARTAGGAGSPGTATTATTRPVRPSGRATLLLLPMMKAVNDESVGA